VLINNIFVEFFFVTTSGVVGLRWQQGTPMGWRWVVDHFFITHPTLQEHMFVTVWDHLLRQKIFDSDSATENMHS
jgi:hypothetical protein